MGRWVRWAFYVVSIVLANAQSPDECMAHRVGCELHRRTGNMTGMKETCQKCYSACIPNSAANMEYCLRSCWSTKCLERGDDSVKVDVLYQCKIDGRQCWGDVQATKMDFQPNLIRSSCGKCVKSCNSTGELEDVAYCEDRCRVQGTNCSLASTTVPTPTPVVTKTPPPIIVRSTTIELWEWLGPVIGAIATIIGAVITVVWVRDVRNNKSAPATDNDQPTRQTDDHEWHNEYEGVGVNNIYQHPPARRTILGRLFGRFE